MEEGTEREGGAQSQCDGNASYPCMRWSVAAQVQPFECDADPHAAPAQAAHGDAHGRVGGAQPRRREDRETPCERRPVRREERFVRDTFLQGGGDLLGLEGASSGGSSGADDDDRYVGAVHVRERPHIYTRYLRACLGRA